MSQAETGVDVLPQIENRKTSYIADISFSFQNIMLPAIVVQISP